MWAYILSKRLKYDVMLTYMNSTQLAHSISNHKISVTILLLKEQNIFYYINTVVIW